MPEYREDLKRNNSVLLLIKLATLSHNNPCLGCYEIYNFVDPSEVTAIYSVHLREKICR